MKNKFALVFLASALSVSSAVPVLSYEPITAHADFGSFAGYVDYYYTTDGWSAASAIPGGPEVIAAYLMIKECLSNPITSNGDYDISNFTGGYGQYSHDDVLHQGMICVPSGTYNISDGGIVVFNTDECSVSLSTDSSSQNLSAASIFSSGIWTNVLYADNSHYFYITPLGSFSSAGQIFPCLHNVYFNFQSSGIPSWSPETLNFASWLRSSTPKLGGVCISNLPSWDITPDTFDAYITDTLNPYLLREYPGTDTLIYVPEAEPIYPTDFVTGVPKDWTITNPQLPEIPKIGIDKPSGDLPTISLAPYAHGVGFWWALVGEILDTTALKSLCITFLGVGLLIYCLWRLGR